MNWGQDGSVRHLNGEFFQKTEHEEKTLRQSNSLWVVV
jgi:hypothetical protein